MNSVLSLIRRHPLGAFFVLAYAFAWILIALAASGSLVFGFIALFGPAVAAILVTGIVDGRQGVRALWRRVVQWRAGVQWYAVAIGLPIVLGVLALALNSVLSGAPIGLNLEQPLGLTLVLAVLVIGEEIGWRGFALPRLQQRYNSFVASLILGALWAAWHLPNALLGLNHYVTSFPAFLAYVVGMTVLFTWLANHTRNSVLLAWIFHAAINAFGAYLSMGDIARQWWLSAAVYGATALLVLILSGASLGRKTEPAQTVYRPAEAPTLS